MRFHRWLSLVSSLMHPALQFTYEKKFNSFLHFLDALVQRSNARFPTSYYRKPSFIELYTRQEASCSKQLKSISPITPKVEGMVAGLKGNNSLMFFVCFLHITFA